MACRIATRLALVAVLILGALLHGPPAHGKIISYQLTDTGVCWVHAPRCAALVQLRADAGLPGLDQDRDLQAEAQAWADHMAATGVLEHSGVTYGAEIVGMGPDDVTVRAAFMLSPEHREIILDGSLRRVGIGHAWAGDHLWISVRFDY